MKKKLLLSAVCTLSLGAYAQDWVVPSEPSKGSEVVSGHKYRIKNVAASQNEAGESYFLSGGMSWFSWSTSTVLVNPAEGTTPITYTLSQGEKGWTFAREDGKFTFISAASPQGIENSGEMHVDQGSQDENLRYFDLMKVGDYYRIFAAKENPAFDINVYDGDTPVLFWGWATDNWDGEKNEYPTAVYATVSPSEGYGCDWEFLDYTNFDALNKLYALWEKNKDCKVDFSAAKSVYDNPASSVEALESAYEALNILINEYKASTTTFDDPADLTDQIGDGSDVAPWTREFTGNGTVGTWHTNTWSTEANDGADGTDMVIPFCEDWVANGSLLSDQKIYKVIKNCAPGLYVFNANVRLYNEKGDQDALTGCTMYFGDDKIDISSQVEMYKSGNKCVLWKDGGFRLITVLEETGDIEVGFEIKDATFNWLAFKDTKLMYYGNDDVNKHAVDFYKEGYSYEKNEEDAYAMASLVEAYNNAVDAFDNAADLQQVREAIVNVAAAKEAMESNHKAYETLIAKINDWQENVRTQDLNGAEWDAFVDYMGGGEAEGYPTPNPNVIKDEQDRSLDNEQIEAYIKQVEENYSNAVAHSLIEGSDCTAMLVNPKFEEAGGAGWTWQKNDGITATNPRGGNAEFYCAEAYGGWDSNQGFLFDVYQDVNDVPDGIYRITANCFYRWADNGQFDGSEIVPAVIYMNDFESPVQHIASNAVEEVMQEDGTTLLEGWYGSWVKTEGIGYVPNSMDAASCAFSKDMYKQTVYGLVEDGKMRIGIKKDTKTSENRHWCLWTNFKLTFMDKNEEAVESIVGDLKNTLSAMLESDMADNVNEDLVVAAGKLVDKALGSAEENYQLMKDLNQAIKDIKKQDDEYKSIQDELQKLYDAVNEAFDYEEYSNDENYQKVVDSIDEWQNTTLNKFEDKTLTDEERASVAKTVSEYIARLGIKGDWTKATEETPVDLTSLIVNADFSAGNASGWTDTFTNGNHGYQQNAEYGDTSYEGAYCSKFVEAWKSNSVALDDGSISQTIGELGYSFLAELPAGNYILKADINAQNQGDARISGGVFLYAMNAGNVYQKEIETTNTEEGTVVRTNEVKFTVGEADRQIEIGVKTVGTECNWFTADNFKLIYLGVGEAVTPDATAIAEITNSNAARVIFDLTGRQVSKVAKGIYIVNGKKVVVK